VVELRDEDLRVDVIRMAGRPCAIRVTQLPTGKVGFADDQDSIPRNRDVAIERLKQALAD
jgi:protein subunit release factor A